MGRLSGDHQGGFGRRGRIGGVCERGGGGAEIWVNGREMRLESVGLWILAEVLPLFLVAVFED